MKKFLPLLALILSIGLTAYSQIPSTSFETDFSAPGSSNGNWASIDDGADPSQFIFTVENGEMKIEYSKSSWHFIQMWIKPFDLTGSPYMSFRMKAQAATDLGINVKDDAGNIVPRTASLTTEWQTFFFNFSDDLSVWTTVLAEIQFDVGFGGASGVIYVDDFKMGDAAKPVLSPPTIDPVTNLLTDVDAGLQTIQLEGISSGGDAGQAITVLAVSDNLALIPSVAVSYTSPESTGTLSFTPTAGMSGEANITVTVADDGILENKTTTEFSVFVAKYGGDGFTEDFESVSIDTLWDLTNADYALNQSGSSLNIDVHKNSGWESFSRSLDGFYNIADKPVVNIDVKGSRSFYLHVYLKDAEGQVAMQQVRVMKTDKFVTTTFDFSEANDIKLDRIIGLIFAFNGNALSFDAEVCFDNLKLGSAASKAAYMAGVPDQSYFINSGKHKLVLTDIENATGVIVATNNRVIENATVSDMANGMATLNFDMIADSIGTDTVTISVLGKTGFNDYTEIFIVSVEQNAAPVVDQATNILAVSGEEVLVRLTGIRDGNPNDEQVVTISASSSDATVIPNPVAVSYSEGPYASMTFTPIATGSAEITVSLVDDGGGTEDSLSMSFQVDVYSSLNQPPLIDPVGKQNVFNDAGEISLELSGISDGDNGNQLLTIKVVSSEDSIVPNPVLVEYSGGETALLKYTPNSSYTGTSTISIKIMDDGGTPDNNGNDSTYISFDIETRKAPLTGWVVPLGDGDLHDLFSAEQENVSWFLSYVDSVDFKAFELRLENKWEYGGIWMDLPVELDLTNYPYISYDVYPVGNTLTKTVDGNTDPITDTYHWNYFYDVNGERNILNSGSHQYDLQPDQWTRLSFDYSDPGDMLTGEGEEILTDRISNVLFNLHWRQGEWPFTDMSGTVLYRNIRIGDQAIVPPKVPVATIDDVPGQALYANSGEYTITLTGISNGLGSVDGVTLSTFSGRSSILPDPVLGEVLTDGSATLTMTVSDKTGSTPITVTVSAEGVDQRILTFDVDVVSNEVATMTRVTIDRSERFQIMDGFGTFENERRWIDMYATDLGASAVRIGLIGNQIEPVNDNNDANVLDMGSLNYGAIDFAYFRMLKEAGVETFILTSWSPPAWMKKNLSQDWLTANAEWDTDAALNRLEYHYYDEFAESMVAVVKMFEQEADIHIEAIGLQNEPAFDEPYASAILDLEHFAELIEVVGKRFEKDGITTRLYLPEQVVGQYMNTNIQYLDALQNNPEANPYCDIFAVHGYGEDGITPGTPTYSEWTQMFNQAQLGDHPKKVWMTETHIGYSNWSSAMSNAGAIHGGLWAGNVSLWTNWSFGDMQLTKNVPNSTFYTSKNYFKYIRPGAVRIGTAANHNDILVTAFEHDEDGTFIVVLINKGNNPVSIDLSGNNLPNGYRAFRSSKFENFIELDSIAGEMFILPGSSVTTLYATENTLLTMDDVTNRILKENDPEQNIPLAGISDGLGGIASLILEVSTTNQTLISDLAVTAIQPDGTAEIRFTPGIDLSGTAQVVVTLTDGTEVREVRFYVVVQSTVGNQELSIQSLKVYPNPATDKLFIDVPESGLEELIITDMMGRVLIQRKIGSENRVEVNLESLQRGLFIVTIGNDQKKYVTRFIVE